MEYLLPLATLAITHLLAAISPGQSFLVVSRTALASGRTPALTATLGMRCGALFWASCAIAGLAVLFQHAAWLYLVMKVGAGLYLLYLAFTLWRQAPQPLEVGNGIHRDLSFAAALRLGLLTQIANPKVIVFFGSIFVALLPADPPAWVYAAVLLIVFANETGWYAIVSCLFSADRPRGVYLRLKPWIDRFMAGLLALIGGKLILESKETL